MLISYLAMQNALLTNNIAAVNMMNASDRIINSVSFGNSQPLRPSFNSDICNDVFIKANDTRLAVSSKLLSALNKKLAKDIKNSAPNYKGLDFKA